MSMNRWLKYKFKHSLEVNFVFYYEINFDNMPGTYWGTVSPDRLSATASYKQCHYLTCSDLPEEGIC